ncbi:MAG: peptigoglycan-binding protein LysM [Firmicutes bacterium HGW-Firmicutes-11]|nr:MAG: peptigoglycan-binding protein LysM [Firmicutes bacterium HGW-Firmicutes-11]
MRKVIAHSLVLFLVLTAFAVAPVLTSSVDAVSAATTWVEGTPTTTTAPTTTTPTSTTAPVAGGDVYVVVSGDTMYKIATKYKLTLDQLLAMNPQVTNRNMIYVGQKIYVSAAKAGGTLAAATELYHGFGFVSNYRVRGAQKDNLNFTTASVLFDQNGRIVDLTWDVMEVTYGLFPGWLDPEADQATKDAFVAAIDNVWETKREEGYAYDMTHLISKGVADNASKKEWFEQLDYFELFFKGMTVAEVEAWFNKYTDVNGRPYKMAYPDKLTDADKAITVTFTPEEQKMLVDVTTSATMSLEDPHSLFITALKEAYAAKELVK